MMMDLCDVSHRSRTRQHTACMYDCEKTNPKDSIIKLIKGQSLKFTASLSAGS